MKVYKTNSFYLIPNGCVPIITSPGPKISARTYFSTSGFSFSESCVSLNSQHSQLLGVAVFINQILFFQLPDFETLAGAVARFQFGKSGPRVRGSFGRRCEWCACENLLCITLIQLRPCSTIKRRCPRLFQWFFSSYFTISNSSITSPSKFTDW